MAFNTITILPLRIAQALTALLILILLSYSAHNWAYNFYYPSQIGFLIFCTVWTILALIYLVLAPMRFQRYAHKYGILAVETVTMIFWFAGFIALADMLRWGKGGSNWAPWSSAVAGALFAAFEWVLFCVTTYMAVKHVLNTRGESGKHDPRIEIQQQHV